MTILAPNPLWRPTATSTRNDRDLIRTYINWPATEGSLVELTQQMNSVATLSPSTVAQVQGWIDEIVTLEETQADAVDAGTAHLGNAEEYEGPIPGTSPTRAQQLSQAGKGWPFARASQVLEEAVRKPSPSERRQYPDIERAPEPVA